MNANSVAPKRPGRPSTTVLPETGINVYDDAAWTPRTNPEYDSIDFKSFVSTKRKVIQISSSQITYTPIHRVKTIIALCDDGTIWEFDTDNRGVWKQLPEIPQNTGSN